MKTMRFLRLILALPLAGSTLEMMPIMNGYRFDTSVFSYVLYHDRGILNAFEGLFGWLDMVIARFCSAFRGMVSMVLVYLSRPGLGYPMYTCTAPACNFASTPKADRFARILKNRDCPKDVYSALNGTVPIFIMARATNESHEFDYFANNVAKKNIENISAEKESARNNLKENIFGIFENCGKFFKKIFVKNILKHNNFSKINFAENSFAENVSTQKNSSRRAPLKVPYYNGIASDCRAHLSVPYSIGSNDEVSSAPLRVHYSLVSSDRRAGLNLPYGIWGRHMASYRNPQADYRGPYIGTYSAKRHVLWQMGHEFLTIEGFGLQDIDNKEVTKNHPCGFDTTTGSGGVLRYYPGLPVQAGAELVVSYLHSPGLVFGSRACNSTCARPYNMLKIQNVSNYLLISIILYDILLM